MLAAHQDVAYRNIEVTTYGDRFTGRVRRVTTMNAAAFGELQRTFLEQ